MFVGDRLEYLVDERDVLDPDAVDILDVRVPEERLEGSVEHDVLTGVVFHEFELLRGHAHPRLREEVSEEVLLLRRADLRHYRVEFSISFIRSASNSLSVSCGFS